jgi:hypothetical protein
MFNRTCIHVCQLAVRFRLWIRVPTLVQLPDPGQYPSFSTPNVKTDESDMLGRGFIPANDQPFTYFLTKYYSFPEVAPLKSLVVAITDVEMDVNKLFNTNCLLLVSSAKQKQLLPQLRHLSYRETRFTIPY